MRSRAVVLVLGVAGVLTGCGGHGAAAPPPPTTTAVPSPTGTSDDSCYLVLLDLKSISEGSDKATVLTQMTSDASTGSPALKAAVAAYEKSGTTGAITSICG